MKKVLIAVVLAILFAKGIKECDPSFSTSKTYLRMPTGVRRWAWANDLLDRIDWRLFLEHRLMIAEWTAIPCSQDEEK